MNDFLLSIRQIDLNAFQKQLQCLDDVVQNRQYQDIVEHATAAIHQVFTSQLCVLFDIRAYAYAMQGRFTAACADAEKMNHFAPSLPTGYIREGAIYSMYGQQTRAIDAYDKALDMNGLDNKDQRERLVKRRAAVADLIKKRVDFIFKLPTEIAQDIIAILPQNTIVTCMSVSKTWRDLTIACMAAWTKVTIDGDEEDMQLIGASAQIGGRVKILRIDTAREPMRTLMFDRMKNGDFNKIQSFELTAKATDEIEPHVPAILTSLWQAQHTLTQIEIDLADNMNEAITVADILSTCSALTDLIYSTNSTMASMTGDFSTVDNHDALTNLELSSLLIREAEIGAILGRCQNLQRLRMDGCDSTVFQPIYDDAPNLRILGYNAGPDIPDLSSIMGRNCKHVAYEEKRQKKGLQMIFTNDSGTVIPNDCIIPLLYKNRNTLEILRVLMGGMTDIEFEHYSASYPDFKLPNAHRLAFWGFPGIQTFMLRTIRETTSLICLNMMQVSDLREVVDTVMGLPHLVTLSIEHDIHGEEEDLVRLFEHEAALSSVNGGGESLENVELRNCHHASDHILALLAKIETLTTISLHAMPLITTEGLSEFLKKKADKLISVELGEMGITDSILMDIARCSKIVYVTFDNLYITDAGLRNMIDEASGSLRELWLTNCPLITEDCINYAKQRLETVECFTTY